MDEASMVGPFYLINGETGDKTLLGENPERDFGEQAGYLLMAGSGPLVDLRTGRVVLPASDLVRSMVWVEPLRP